MIDAEAIGQPSAHDMGHLGRRDHFELFEARIPICRHALAFYRRHALPRRAETALDRDRGLFGGGLNIAVSPGLDECFQKDIVAPFLVQQRGVGVARLQHVRHGRQDVVFHHHAVGHVFRLGAGRGHAHGDQLADLTDFFTGQRRLGRWLVAGQGRIGADRRDIGHVVGGKDTRPDVLRNVDG